MGRIKDKLLRGEGDQKSKMASAMESGPLGAAPVSSNCIPDQVKVQGIVHISLKDIKYHNMLYASEDKVRRRRRWSLSTLAQSTVASILNVPETSASPGHFKGPLEEGSAAAQLSGEVPLV